MLCDSLLCPARNCAPAQQAASVFLFLLLDVQYYGDAACYFPGRKALKELQLDAITRLRILRDSDLKNALQLRSRLEQNRESRNSSFIELNFGLLSGFNQAGVFFER